MSLPRVRDYISEPYKTAGKLFCVARLGLYCPY